MGKTENFTHQLRKINPLLALCNPGGESVIIRRV